MFVKISAFKAAGRVNSSLCDDRKYKMTNLLKRDECKIAYLIGSENPASCSSSVTCCCGETAEGT